MPPPPRWAASFSVPPSLSPAGATNSPSAWLPASRASVGSAALANSRSTETPALRSTVISSRLASTPRPAKAPMKTP